MVKSAENKLIFLIASFCESKDEWIDVFSSPLPRIQGFPKRDKSIRAGIDSLLKKEMLEFKEDKERILIRPTLKAFKNLATEYPFYNNFIYKWDGKFYLITYDISEKNRKLRDSLRWILKSYKLGILSQSIYVSAYDIKKDLYNSLNSETAKKAISYYTIKVDGEQIPDFLKLVFNFENLSSRYNELIKDLDTGVNKIKLRRTKVEAFRKGYIDYKKLLEEDSGIPFELTPNNYHLKVRKLLKRLQKSL